MERSNTLVVQHGIFPYFPILFANTCTCNLSTVLSTSKLHLLQPLYRLFTLSYNVLVINHVHHSSGKRMLNPSTMLTGRMHLQWNETCPSLLKIYNVKREKQRKGTSHLSLGHWGQLALKTVNVSSKHCKICKSVIEGTKVCLMKCLVTELPQELHQHARIHRLKERR